MWSSIKYQLFNQWNIIRFIRLMLGIIILVQAILMRDFLIGAISIYFLYQAIFNQSCCGTNNCSTPK
ncbi:MAG: hypothetical protein R2739_00075 [Chitinophagales bacterium]|nr:hypothetical protein [Bacteroidota bacterium]